jgi:hypothetical protein
MEQACEIFIIGIGLLNHPARDPMIRANLAKNGLLMRALFHRNRAAWMEAATFWWI